MPARRWLCLVLALSCLGWAGAAGGPRLGSPPQGFAADPYCKVREALEEDPPRRQICYSYPGGEAGDRVVISEFSEVVSDRRAQKILKMMISGGTRLGLDSSVSFTAPRRMRIDGKGCWTSLETVKDGREVRRLELIAIVPSPRNDVTYLIRFQGVSPRFRNEGYMRQVVGSFHTRGPISVVLLQLGGVALVLVGVIWLVTRRRGRLSAPAPPRGQRMPGLQVGRAPARPDPGREGSPRVPGGSWEEWMGAAGPKGPEKGPPAAIPLSPISTFHPSGSAEAADRGALWNAVAGPEAGPREEDGTTGELRTLAVVGANPDYPEAPEGEGPADAMDSGAFDEMFGALEAARASAGVEPGEVGSASGGPDAEIRARGAATAPPPPRPDPRPLVTRDVPLGSPAQGKLEGVWEAFRRRPLKALAQMQALWSGDPVDPRLGHALVLMRARARQIDQAIELARMVIPRCLEAGELQLAAEAFAALLQQAGRLELDYRQLVTIGFTLEQQRDTARAAHAFARALRLEPAGEPAAEGLLRVADRLMVDEASREQARGIYQYVINHGEAVPLVERARQRLDQSYVSSPDPLLH